MSKKHILFIDDEEDILFLVKFYFREEINQEKIKFTAFHDSKEAMSFLDTDEAQDLSAVVTDINMPEFDGFDILNSLQMKKSKALTYLCSAYDRIDYKEKGEGFGVKRFFNKPVDMNEMKEQILLDLALAAV